MSVSLIVLIALWTACVVLLIISLFTRNESTAFWGDLMLALSFGVTSGMLIKGGSLWMGAAFAFPAVKQLYVLAAPRLAKGRHR
jgi:hypothetical protein